MNPPAKQRVALVTGVSSGIGATIAERLVQDGYRVFGSARSQNSSVPGGVERVLFDVRDEGSIGAAVQELVGKAGRIDALVNNAGATILGAIEETTIEQARDLFDVNFFGAARVTQAVLPFMRAQRAGRLLFVSSVVGFIPSPFMGFYAASKHAMEGYAESLDHEIRTFGVRSIIIEPGYTKTKIDNNAVRAGRPIAEYQRMREAAEASINEGVLRGDDPEIVADVVSLALRVPRPRRRYAAGSAAKMLSFARAFAPAALFDRTLRQNLKLDGEAAG